jgi:hypothetical protein
VLEGHLQGKRFFWFKSYLGHSKALIW